MLLSIIVPVYNKEKYITECITSILNQDFTDFELILVNDGSTDNSLEKCKFFEFLDKRIFIVDQPNAGVSAARNAGIKLAQGKYIGFIDSDDTIEKDMFSTLVNNAETHQADISVVRMKTIMPNKTLTVLEEENALIFNHNEALIKCLRGEFDRSANNKIYLAEIAKNIQFKGTINEDILFVTKAFVNSKKVVLQNKMLYNYIVRDNSASMTKFGSKYMQMADFSSEITTLIQDKNPNCVEYAYEFEVLSNLSLLNLMLLAEKNAFTKEYKRVEATLKQYSPFINKSNIVRKKHKYAYKIFSFSPSVYKNAMRLYCSLTNSEALSRV
jgi:glycosyltransferase involved in cell wall biosynthesis